MGDVTDDWLVEFMRSEERSPGKSCTCSGDCDKERKAAFQEIHRLRAVILEPTADPGSSTDPYLWESGT